MWPRCYAVCVCLSRPLSTLQYSHLYSLIPTWGFKSAKTAPHCWDIWPCWSLCFLVLLFKYVNTFILYFWNVYYQLLLNISLCWFSHWIYLTCGRIYCPHCMTSLEDNTIFVFVTVLSFPWRWPSFIWWCQMTLKRPSCGTMWRNEYQTETS